MKPKYTELRRLQGMYESFTSLTVSRGASERYSAALKAFFSRFPDKERPSEFTRRDIEDYRVFRLREGRNPTTINYEIRTVAAFWDWMILQERVSWNPAKQVKRLKQREAEKQSLTIDQQLKLRQGAYTWGDRALLALALSTGLRAETLVALDRSEFDFEAGILTIPSSKMKAGRNHTIPLPGWVLAVIREAPEGRIFEGYAKTAGTLRYRWRRICARVGISTRGIRTARRTFATTLLRSGADLKIVQDLLGHKNITTTSLYITPADVATVREAVEKLPQVL